MILFSFFGACDSHPFRLVRLSTTLPIQSRAPNGLKMHINKWKLLGNTLLQKREKKEISANKVHNLYDHIFLSAKKYNTILPLVPCR